MAHRHVCVHGHFYQPPRENPWLGEVEREDSAFPFHDWNARVAEECYGPMVLGTRGGSDGRAIAFENLLRRISFNFGPTLLSWLERARPSLYRRVLEADRVASAAGPGNALAQPYFHVILPLASRRDKETLVRWGVADFRARFGRRPEGLWLPETAVDDETLDVLAAEGIEFTVLAPAQAEAVRSIGGDWTAAAAETLDPKTPYRWTSPRDAERSLALFFYHQRLSHGIVTGETLASAEVFAQAVRARLLPGDAAQLVHIASDGEFYGHHHPGAERVLAVALDVLADEGVAPINHARFLKLFPPPHDAKVRRRTAWSCPHGLGRWESDCGCRSAHLPDWRQEWRGPLRAALDKLAVRLDAFYADEAARYFDDPWTARDASVALWTGRGDASARFFVERAKRPLTGEEEDRARRLLLMQRERLAMFTSCGWFFDDVSGVEAVLVLQRAARALDLARGLGENAEEAFVERLAAAKSNVASFGDAAGVYRRLVLPTRVTLERAAAHAAILEAAELPPPRWPEAFTATLGPAFRARKTGLAGRDRTLSMLPVSVTRADTREAADFVAVVHRADRLDFACWLAPRSAELPGAADLGARLLALDDDALRAELDARFGPARFGLDAVFSDERAELVKALAPEGGLGPDRAAFLRRWTQAVSAARRGGREDDVLLEMLFGARDRGLEPKDLPWARELEDRMYAHLEAVLTGGGAAVSRALRWLDALWRAELLTGTWRLRDFQRRWSEALAAAGPSAEKDACRALGERLGLAENLLEDAKW